MVELLAPDHPRESLPHHGGLVLCCVLGLQRPVELVGFALALGEGTFEAGAQIRTRESMTPFTPELAGIQKFSSTCGSGRRGNDNTGTAQGFPMASLLSHQPQA